MDQRGSLLFSHICWLLLFTALARALTALEPCRVTGNEAHTAHLNFSFPALTRHLRCKTGIEDERWKWVRAHRRLYFPVSACLWRAWIRRPRVFTPVPLQPADTYWPLDLGQSIEQDGLGDSPLGFKLTHQDTLAHCCAAGSVSVVSGSSCLLRRSTQGILALKTEARRFSPATTFSVFDKWVMC